MAREILRVVFSAVSAFAGSAIVLLAILMSPLQDWDGNAIDIEADRVLAICTLFVLAMVANLIRSFFLILLRKKSGMA